MLIEHENMIGELYKAYSMKFHEENEFWATLSWEEGEHAKSLGMLSELIDKGHVRFESAKFKPVVIKTSLEYVSQELEKAKKGNITLENAMAVALNIEKALVDGQIFEAFTGFTAEAKKLVRNLSTSFNDHYQTIQKAWSEHRKF